MRERSLARVASCLLAMAAAGLAAAAGLLDESPAPEVVRAAHAAYLAEDHGRAVALVRQALAAWPEDEAVQSNMLGLADRLMERSGERLPLGWTLPPELRSLHVGVNRRRVPGRGPEWRRFHLVLGVQKAGSVRQLKVVRHPDRVVIDVAAGTGITGDHHSPRYGEFLWAIQPLEDGESSDGLYLLNVTLSSGKEVAGWFVLHRAEASATPLVQVPTPEQVLPDANPTLRLGDFRSPEYRPFEVREMVASVERIGAGAEPDDSEEVWARVVDEPALTALLIGPAPDLERSSAPRLAPGRYRFELTFREQRRFGPVVVSRDSTTAVPFQIRY